MSDNTTFTATDMRRAAALLTHYAAGDLAGVYEITRETIEADALADLAGALAAVFFQLSPELRTQDGVALLRELTRAFRAAEAATETGGTE
ncbi:hypothetical protein [Mycobacterium sp. OTB74]|jgi:hypothetical protein|uniref:hypothetical protein n=1 Tax=Mycobacterium sp. OTB74 TaxID=1853452 RepID=UPI002473B429|nr:hypothetical protein [Mycobacterium sp. OTB74]MDH6245741.1 hypothetical protein [Mycobacterium sp. OTB74]